MSESYKVRILDLVYYMDTPPRSGGILRILNPFMYMSSNTSIEVDILFSTWEEAHAVKCAKYLRKFPVINSVNGVIARHYLNNHDGMPESFSSAVWESMSIELRDRAVEMVKLSHYDIIQVEHSQLSWVVPFLRAASPASKIVLDLHNAEHLIYKRWIPYAREEERDGLVAKYRTLYDWESETWKWFDAGFCVSPIEADMLRDLGEMEQIYLVPTGGGIDPQTYCPKDDDRKRPYDILYLGTMEWFPNAQGLLWFIDNVFPLVLEKRPGTKLHIVGFGNPDGELCRQAEAHPNIKFWGEQDDDKKFFHGARVFIVPLWIGAGARVKIPTAWASKVPVVSTDLGAEGLDAVNGENIVIADEPEDFAKGVLRLLDNTDFRANIVDRAFETLTEKYSINQCIDILIKAYHELAAEKTPVSVRLKRKWILDENERNFLDKLSERITLENKSILEIGCGKGNLTRVIASENLGSYVTGIDLIVRETDTSDEHGLGCTWKIMNGDGMNLPFENESFNLVISLATFEYIQDPGKCISEIYRVLKPGGELFVDFAPVWSSLIGHHYNHWIQDDVLMIPPWAHLYMTYDELYEHLIKTETKERAKNICYDIYLNQVINRKDINYFKEELATCGLEIIEWKNAMLKNRLGWLGGPSESELTPMIYGKLSNRYSEEDLYICGMMLHMRKK